MDCGREGEVSLELGRCCKLAGPLEPDILRAGNDVYVLSNAGDWLVPPKLEVDAESFTALPMLDSVRDRPNMRFATPILVGLGVRERVGDTGPKICDKAFCFEGVPGREALLVGVTLRIVAVGVVGRFVGGLALLETEKSGRVATFRLVGEDTGVARSIFFRQRRSRACIQRTGNIVIFGGELYASRVILLVLNTLSFRGCDCTGR